MPRDVFTQLNRCRYCNRPGVVVWDTDLSTCREEVCMSLGFARVRGRPQGGPERWLAHALLDALDAVEYAIGRDEQLDVVGAAEAQRMRDRERQQTAWLLSDLRALERRYPTPVTRTEPERIPRPNPRYRRFVGRGRSVPLRHLAA